MADVLEGKRDAVDAQALCIAGDARLEVDKRRFLLAAHAGGSRLCGRRERFRRELHLGGYLAVDARMALEVLKPSIESVCSGVARSCANRRLEADAAVGLGGAGGDAHLALGFAPVGRSLERERSLDRFGLQLAVEAAELGEADAARTVEGHRPVGDLDRLQGHARRNERQRPGSDGKAAPVTGAFGIDREAQHRLFQHDLVGLDDAFQERRRGEAHREAFGAEERLAGGAGRIGDAQLLEAHVGRRQQAHVDVAADTDFAPENACRLLLEHAAIAVPIDEIGNGKQRREGQRDQPRNIKKPVIHLTFQGPERHSALSARNRGVDDATAPRRHAPNLCRPFAATG